MNFLVLTFSAMMIIILVKRMKSFNRALDYGRITIRSIFSKTQDFFLPNT